MSEQQHRVALVTGAGSGMGQRCAQRLLAAGWRVAAMDINETGLQALGRSAQLMTLVVDVCDGAAVAKAVQRVQDELGPPTRVVHAAAIMPFAELMDMDAALINRVMAINYGGLVAISKATVPIMQQQGQGAFVSFASLAGQVPMFYMGAYAASKAAVAAYTEILYEELKGSGVHVCCVCPPPVNTPLLEQGRDSRWPKVLDMLPPLRADQVLDAVDRAISKQQLWVYPGWYTRPGKALRTLLPRVVWQTSRWLELR